MDSTEDFTPLPRFMQGLTNIKRASARQYDWLHSHRCSHRHKYTVHFSCFLKDYDVKERLGFLDIETSNLKADFGIVLCWCILDDQNKMFDDSLSKKDIIADHEDKRVVQSCIEMMLTFDRIITHYGTYFDIPFLRTRSLIHGIKFPEYGQLWHSDVWKLARRSLCIHSNRQDCVAEALQGKTIKTRIEHPAWRKAAYGDAEAIAEVLDHCRHDVPDLKKNFYSLLPFNRLVNTSI